jgi:hypothetical protein
MLPRGSIADKDASEPEPEAGSSGFVQVVSPVHQCVGDIACHAFGGGGVVASMAVWVGDLEPDCDGSFASSGGVVTPPTFVVLQAEFETNDP